MEENKYDRSLSVIENETYRDVMHLKPLYLLSLLVFFWFSSISADMKHKLFQELVLDTHTHTHIHENIK